MNRNNKKEVKKRYGEAGVLAEANKKMEDFINLLDNKERTYSKENDRQRSEDDELEL